MAKFDLKFSNIVKVVLVILLVVGLYNLVYNSNVFNYNMYEGFTSEQIPKILVNATEMYKFLVDFAEKASAEFADKTSQSNLTINSDIKPLLDAATDTSKYISFANHTIIKLLDLLRDNLDDNTTQIITDIKKSSKEATYNAQNGLDKVTHLNTDFIRIIKDLNSKTPDKTNLNSDLSDVSAIKQDISGYISDLAAVVKNAKIVVIKLNDLITSIQASKKESFTNLYPSNVDQSINCSLMQPYASYKCGPINPEKSFFDNIDFKPECCPSTYSSSQGCACLCPQQINYLNSRGGNRTFPTQF